MEARRAKIRRKALVSHVPDEAATPAAILQAIKTFTPRARARLRALQLRQSPLTEKMASPSVTLTTKRTRTRMVSSYRRIGTTCLESTVRLRNGRLWRLLVCALRPQLLHPRLTGPRPGVWGKRLRDSPIRDASVVSDTPSAKKPRGVRRAPESEVIKQDTPDRADVEYSLALDGRGQRLRKSLEAAQMCL